MNKQLTDGFVGLVVALTHTHTHTQHTEMFVMSADLPARNGATGNLIYLCKLNMQGLLL